MLDAAHGESVSTAGKTVQRIDVGGVEVQTARCSTAGSGGRRRPIVALGADIRQATRRAVAVARSRRFSSNRWNENRKGNLSE